MLGRTGRGQGCSSSSQTREMGQGKRGKQGHSPLLIFMSQEKVLHLLPSEVELVVIVALNCLCLIHGVVQGQEEFFEGLHYGWWHTQVNLCNAA